MYVCVYVCVYLYVCTCMCMRVWFCGWNTRMDYHIRDSIVGQNKKLTYVQIRAQ